MSRVRWQRHLPAREQKNSCKDCPDGKCVHGRKKQSCKECGGSRICEHGRRKSQCKQCGGSAICEHKQQRLQCRECIAARAKKEKKLDAAGLGKRGRPKPEPATDSEACDDDDDDDDNDHEDDVEDGSAPGSDPDSDEDQVCQQCGVQSDGRGMLACETCGGWFHYHCVAVDNTWFFHESVDLTRGLGRTAAGGRRAC